MPAETQSFLVDWLLTWWLHAAIMLGAVALVARRIPSLAARDLLWKVALVAPLFTATAHSFSATVRRVDVGPIVRSSVVTAAGETAAGTAAEKAAPTAAVGESPSAAVFAASPAASSAALSAAVPSAAVLDWRSSALTAWLLVASVLLAGLVIRRVRLIHSMGPRTPVSDTGLSRQLEALCLSANYPHAVRLTSSATLASPVALPGHEICIPSAVVTDLGPEHQRGVLAHELAHLVRRDPLWLGFAQVLERLFFLQPLLSMARREMQVTAEYLCDDWAARQAGTGLPLARCLLTVAEWLNGASGPVPEPAMAARGSHLLRRVERLVRGDALHTDPGRRLGLAAAAVLVVGTAVAMPAVIAGQAQSLEPLRQLASNAHENQKDSERQDTTKSARVAALVGALKDSDPDVRVAAAEALGNLEQKSAAPALAEAMRDPDVRVQRAATFALGEMEDPRAIPGLTRLLSDADADVRQEAADDLGNFELTEAPPALIAALKDSDADVRQAATHTLGHIGDPKSVPALKAMLTDQNKHVRQAAVEALHEIDDPAALQALIDALKSSDPVVRKEAAEALGNR